MRAPSRRTFLESVGGAVFSGLSGCLGEYTAGETEPALESLGYTGAVHGSPWIRAYAEATRFYAQDVGIELEMRPSRGSVTRQAEAIRDFVDEGVDGILVRALRSDLTKAAIDSAFENDVPVFTTSIDSKSKNIPMFTGVSQYDAGRTCAAEMLRILEERTSAQKPWQLLHARLSKSSRHRHRRSKGFLDVVRSTDTASVKTVSGASRGEVLSKIRDRIGADQRPDGIYSVTYPLGLGTVQVLRDLDALFERSHDNHIVLANIDGSPQVNAHIRRGFIDVAIDQPNYFYNPIAIEYMKRYLEHGRSMDAIPEFETTVRAGDIRIEPSQHKGTTLWQEPIWAPAESAGQYGHLWFETNSVTITEQNADRPFLWGNIWTSE